MALRTRKRRKKLIVFRHGVVRSSKEKDLRWSLHGPPPKRCEPESLSSVGPRILMQTESFVVVEKPPDVRMDGEHCPVTLERLAESWGLRKVRWAHRLDYGTSGILLGSLSKVAASAASRAFEVGAAKKVYLAVALGTIKKDLVIDKPIASTPSFLMSVEPEGKPSKTLVKVLQHGTYRGVNVTKLELRPLTGRRHQLRVHLNSIGHPLVGDATYHGGRLADAPRMMLHAFQLTVEMDDGVVRANTPDPFPFTRGRLTPVKILPEKCFAQFSSRGCPHKK